MNRIVSKLILWLLVLLLCGCSDSNDEWTKLQQRFSILERENIEQKALIDNLNTQILELQMHVEEKPIKMSRVSGVSYIGLLENEMVRFISNQTELKALPFDDAPIINTIEPNTLVKVLLKASNGYYDDLDTVWYFVSIPVYDTPSDCFGWVKYNQSSDYTVENQKILMDPISIRIGSIYSYTGPPNFDPESKLTVQEERRGQIIDNQDEYVKVMFAGGDEFWVKKADIIYPEFP